MSCAFNQHLPLSKNTEVSNKGVENHLVHFFIIILGSCWTLKSHYFPSLLSYSAVYLYAFSTIGMCHAAIILKMYSSPATYNHLFIMHLLDANALYCLVPHPIWILGPVNGSLYPKTSGLNTKVIQRCMWVEAVCGNSITSPFNHRKVFFFLPESFKTIQL